jgi:hypothetical protein
MDIFKSVEEETEDPFRKAAIKADIDLEAAKLNRAKIEAFTKGKIKNLSAAGYPVGRSLGQGIRAGMRQQVDFSQEQIMLQQMFGGGDKIWGVNMQPVRINNDLNPSRSSFADETSSMFGWGPHGERSGLF